MKLRAGYVSQAVFDLVRTWSKEHVDWMKVLEQISCFDAEGLPDSESPPSSVIAVVSDIISRGAPTLCSLRVEQELSQRLGLTTTPESDSGASGLRTTFTKETSKEEQLLLFRAMLPVSSDLTLDEIESALISGSNGKPFDSEAEREFFRGPLLELLGENALQFVQAQRSVESIAEECLKQFVSQRVDFAFQFVGDVKTAGIVFEVDGPHHLEDKIHKLDIDRDTMLMNQEPKWCSCRRSLVKKVATDSILLADGVAKALKESSVYQLIRSFTQLDSSDPKLVWRELIHLPLAVARVQRTILEAIRTGLLDQNCNVWRIGIVDRDDIGNVLSLAVDDMADLITAISDIHGVEYCLPKIETSIVAAGSVGQVDRRAETEYDLVIDISIALKKGQRSSSARNVLRHEKVVVIRTLWGEQAAEQYKSLSANILQPIIEPEQFERRLRGYQYILQNVFRKSSFREKQVEVIDRIIQGESVIALLPTGAGKSLTYQLPALVLCGAVIVVDPIRSLMKDQVDSLLWIGINCTGWMNSWLTTAERRKTANRLLTGGVKILFISPERMQINEFRTDLAIFATENDKRFAFAVIDEAHCVSEWGHDFRTAYLRVGDNLRRFMKGYKDNIPLAALTGTASFEVLDDVKIELGLAGRRDVDIRPESMQRTNLRYRVIASDVKEKDMVPKLNTIVTEQSIVAFLEKRSGSGLVFVPHIKGKLGTGTAHTVIRKEVPEMLWKVTDQFHGGENDGGMMDVMDRFKNGEVRLLCCTKAFGMGIDKPDIRFTLHLNEPPSLEAFYQEAGRAGRDGEASNCWMLWSKKNDAEVCMNFINSSFRSPGFDFQKAIEILDYNQHYADQLTRLSEDIISRYGYDLKLNIWSPIGKPDKVSLYVNDRGAEFLQTGKLRINLTQDTITAQGSCKDQAVLDYLISKISEISEGKRGQLLKEQLLAPHHELESLIPVREMLEKLRVGDTGSALISLNNGVLTKLAREWNISREDLEDTYRFSSGPRDFSKRVQNMVIESGMDIVPTEDDLKSAFTRARIDSDTYKAVYRLSVLGLIEDYTVDYRTSTVEVVLRRLSQDEMRARTRRYIARYAPLSMDEFLSQLPESPSIDECLHLLVDFVYKRIKTQRLEALKVMDQTAEKGLEDPYAFEDAIVQYFDSSLLPVLRTIRDKYTISDIMQIIIDTDNANSQLAHLLGAANRLLPEVPDNAAYHFFRAYALEGLKYTAEDVAHELETAIELFIRQGWEQGDLVTLCGFAGEALSKTHERMSSPFIAYHLSYHNEQLRAINHLVN